MRSSELTVVGPLDRFSLYLQPLYGKVWKAKYRESVEFASAPHRAHWHRQLHEAAGMTDTVRGGLAVLDHNNSKDEERRC